MSKMISANKLNRFWKNGVLARMIAKTKVLKTMEEISANTNAENVVSATVVAEINDNLTFPDGVKFYPDIQNGERGYNTDPARGADTFVPFNKGLTIKGTLYTDVRQYVDHEYVWFNKSSTQINLSIRDGQTNISITGNNGVIAGMTALDFIRSRFVIDSVSID